jgi:peptide-methionine (R)-S-oxide reductase
MGPTFLLVALLSACGLASGDPGALPAPVETFEVVKTDAGWRDVLTDEEYRILRNAGTERAFTGKYWDNHAHGVYRCAGCGQLLFRSEHKFDSGTGWPSYWQPAETGALASRSDASHGMSRTEVLCGRCGGHLGHVFPDGPPPTGQRYCINGNALDFEAVSEGEPTQSHR